MAEVTLGGPCTSSKILTVVLILSSLGFQVATAFCWCSGNLGCYECQCTTERDCSLRENALGNCRQKLDDKDCVQLSPMDCDRYGGERCRKQGPGCNFTDCLGTLSRRFSCADDSESCDNEDETPQEMLGEKDEQGVPTAIVVPIVVCVTVIILVAIVTVILALYWRFKIRVIRERQANTYTVSTAAANQEAQEDPLYSVLNQQVPAGYTESPPQLPPSRVPYYEEIESDGIGAEKTAPHEIPLISLPQCGHKKDGKETGKNEGEEPYEEPIDALRRVEPSLKPDTVSNEQGKDR